MVRVRVVAARWGNVVITALINTIILGLGIAFNPVAMMASILIVRQKPGGRNGSAFVAGWIVGLAILVVLSSLIALEQIKFFRTDSFRFMAYLWIGLGLGLIVLGGRSLQRFADRKPDETPQRWLKLIEGRSALQAFGIGVGLATFSVRNLALLAAAGSILSQANLTPIEFVISLSVFVVMASLGTLAPVLVRWFGGAGADSTLTAWSSWLVRNMEAITAVFLLLVGGYLFMRGFLVIA